MAMTLVSTVTVGSGLNDVVNVTFNDDSATNYAVRRLQGNGTSASSGNFTAGFVRIEEINGNTSTSNTFANGSMYIANYTGSAAKSTSNDVVSENNATTSWQTISAQSWSGTAAITKISLVSGTSNNFMQHSLASLYIIS